MRLVALIAVASLFACGGNDDSPRKICRPLSDYTTFSEVAPIIGRNCVSCHVEGGSAPFPLRTYLQVRAQAAAIKSATQARTMPPWHVDNSGACQRYLDAPGLTDDEIGTLARWADTGTLPGVTTLVPLPEAPAALTGVTNTLDIGSAYTPKGNGSDDYRCFLVDPGTREDAFLTAWQVTVDQAREVHHVVLFGLADSTAEMQAQMLDATEPGTGYSCFGGPRITGLTVLGGWVPGAGPTSYPEGTGVRLGAGRKLLMQVHYEAGSRAAADRTTVGLVLKPSVEHEAMVLGLTDTDLELPPHLPSLNQGMTATLASLAGQDTYQLLGVFPRMHAMGRTMHAEQLRAGTNDCLIDVPSWDPHAQRFYFYETPIEVSPGDAIAIDCGFDTTSSDAMVKWGEGAGDETCLAGLYVAKN